MGKIIFRTIGPQFVAAILCIFCVTMPAYWLAYTIDKFDLASAKEAEKWKAVFGVPAASSVRVKVIVIPLVHTTLTVVRVEDACGDGLCPNLFQYRIKNREFQFYLWCKERIVVFSHPEKNRLGDKEDVNGIEVDADKFGIVVTPTLRGPMIVPTLEKFKP